MTADGSYEQSDADRDKRYGVVSGHNTRCASLLGQGCDCRSPFPDEPCPACSGTGGDVDGQACSDCLGAGQLPCRCGQPDCPTCGDPRAYVEDMARREEMAEWQATP